MPTIKQKKAFDKVVENGGNVSKAMIESNYSPETAKTPQKLTESKGWKELMDKYLSDDELARVHEEGLNATRTSEKGMEYPDYATRHKYLDSAYKLKGMYAPDKHVSIDLTPRKEESNVDLKELAKKVSEELKNKKLR